MRTVVVQIHDATIYRGKKEDELKHFLLVFRNHVCYKYFKMPEERANWYIASIDRKDEGFRWKEPRVDNYGNIIERAGPGRSKECLRLYVRFITNLVKDEFIRDKRRLDGGSPIFVNFYTNKFFVAKYQALMALGREYQQDMRNKGYPKAQFQHAWANPANEREIYLEVRPGKDSGWHRHPDDLDTLFHMSLPELNKSCLSDEEKEEMRKKAEEHKASKGDLPKIDSKKRPKSYGDIDMDDLLHGFEPREPKRGKLVINSNVSVKATTKITNYTSLLKKANTTTNFGDLVDSSDAPVPIIKNYIANRRRIIENLLVKNELENISWRRTQKNIKTGLHDAVHVNIPTALLMASVMYFLRWTIGNKINCSNQANVIEVTSNDKVTDKADVQTELKIGLKHVVSKMGACIHIYLTQSTMMIQGSGVIQGISFGEWIWHSLVEPTLRKYYKINSLLTKY